MTSVSSSFGLMTAWGHKNILVGVQMDTWYYSPYPEPYASLEKLHVCEFCLKYFGKEKTLIRHMAKCEMRHPPGDEIYRSPPEPKSPGYCTMPIAVFEVCGRTNKVRSASGDPLHSLAAASASAVAAALTGQTLFLTPFVYSYSATLSCKQLSM